MIGSVACGASNADGSISGKTRRSSN
jgi:hypothetical protein